MCEVGVNPNMPQQVVNGHAGGAITAEVYRLHSFCYVSKSFGRREGEYIPVSVESRGKRNSSNALMHKLAGVGHEVVLSILVFGDHNLLEQTASGVVDDAVDLEISLTLGLDDHSVSLEIVDLGAHVELHEAGTLVLGVLDGIQHGLMSHLCVSNGSQPVVNDTQLLGGERRPHSSAVVVTADNDVSHLENLDGKLDD